MASPTTDTSLVEQDPTLPTVTHDIMLRALRCEPVPRSPCWAMRQAGRYLPEFRKLRQGAEFFEVCNNPALCSEATLQPLHRFPATLDAVVVFSDILIVPQAMGLEVRMEPGPVFPAPLTSPEDVAARLASGALTLTPHAPTAFAPLYAGIAHTRRTAAALPSAGGAGKAVPVIGFCGAPWTLFSYMVSGVGRPSPQPPLGAKDSASSPERTRAWLLCHPTHTHALLAALAALCTELLLGCWAAGASVLQVFESAGGELPPHLFQEFALPYMLAIAAGVRARTPPPDQGGPLLIAFPRNQHSRAGLEGLCDSAYDALSLDWGWEPAEAAARVAQECRRLGRGPMALQGNADPALLFGSRGAVWEGARRMVLGFRRGWRAGGGAGACSLVGNLGHGMLPGHDAVALGEFFAAVQAVSARAGEGGEAGGEEGERAACSDQWLAAAMAAAHGEEA